MYDADGLEIPQFGDSELLDDQLAWLKEQNKKVIEEWCAYLERLPSGIPVKYSDGSTAFLNPSEEHND